MKRFIIISLLTVLTLPILACAWEDSHNSYLFHIYCPDEFADRVDKVTRDNWKAYLGLADSDYFWFDAEKVIEAANAKGDELMASYVSYLQRYLDVCNDISGDHWDYPTKEALAQRNREVSSIRLYAQSKLKTRLRSQHALLFMRCNMVLGRHEENVTFWQQTASQFIDSIYKEMMRNIYAGALFHTGHTAEAGQIFAEQGDSRSLMTQYYLLRSYEAIQREYDRDANSAVLPFLLQDFVNNAQEAIDAEHGRYGGKLFIRDIEHAEAMQMIGLAERAVANRQTQHPAMWQTAKAWLEYLFGDPQQAASDIAPALRMEGTEKQLECARLINFYIHCATKPLDKKYDDFVAKELNWMYSGVGENDNPNCYSAIERTAHQQLIPRYLKSGRTNMSLALSSIIAPDLYAEHLDSLDADGLISFLNYIHQPAASDLERFILSRAQFSDDELHDLIARRYLERAEWQEAITWLEKVPVSYYAERGFAPYAALRKWSVEPWITRQWLSDDVLYGDQCPTLTTNPRLVFAREMLAKEQGLNLLKGNIRLQRCYDLAVRYAQADISGDCWFLLADGKSSYFADEAPSFFVTKAVGLLEEAAKSKDFHLRERALFALAYYYLNPDCWHDGKWDSDAGEYVWYPKADTKQYRAFARLVDFERENEGQISDFVSRCDEYRQFTKHYK